jgi:hypothetical protein
LYTSQRWLDRGPATSLFPCHVENKTVCVSTTDGILKTVFMLASGIVEWPGRSYDVNEAEATVINYGCGPLRRSESMKKARKKKFDRATEARRAARKSGAAPASTRVIEDKRKRPPKHKKKWLEKEVL